MPLYFSAETIRLYCDDFLNFNELPPESIDLIVTSPPYDVDIQYDGYVEMIVVMFKEQWQKQQKGISDITREEFLEWTNGVWTFSGESRKKVGHPAPFPIELPRRCIKLFSYVGDVILDPFVGSGTTLLACLQLNRIGIGVEVSESYCALAVKRLRTILNQPKLPLRVR